jgi:hypothetical protein
MKKKIVGTAMFLLVLGCAVLLCSLVIVSFVGAEPIVLPQASYLITDSFTVPPGHTFHNKTLSDGDKLHIFVEVTNSGDFGIDFYVMDESNYGMWDAGESASLQMSQTNITAFHGDWVVPYDGTWYFVYDNSAGSVHSKDVTAIITKHWIETTYREVTQYGPLIPFKYSIPSAIVFFGGIAILVMDRVIKETPVSESAKTKGRAKK